ncbi:MAG: hypothetical protein IT364_01270 [Candidatus Hydrogenedentes bacterium]|nr:hypothetical protein [Candidatus Hydrogenedentota bacterium]
MRGLLVKVMAVALAACAADDGAIKDGILVVDGKPFYPLGSWNFSSTTPEDIARLGMNTSFQGGPSTDAAVEEFRGFMRSCAELGIQVVPYLSYGGAGVVPWAPEAVRSISKLSSEPNLLTWYVGDDITMVHLDGIRQTVTLLREATPSIPTVADYIADETPEARTTFTEFVDIRCQYTYPIPDDTYAEYLEFFDKQRAFVGDPLWTWVQNFMWGRTGELLGVGAEGPGPVPDPEQVRLLAHAAINRGVRGLLFFAHHELHRLPELAAEVALTCRETRLFNDHLAAGTPTFNLATSIPDLNATAFTYQASVVISAALFKPFYQRYVNEGIVEGVTISCPWTGGAIPKTLLLATPDVVECAVAAGKNAGTIDITIPRIELAGFLLVNPSAQAEQTLRAGANAIPDQMKELMLTASAAQTRKVCGVVWQLGLDNLYESEAAVLETLRTQERCAAMAAKGDWREAFLAWRETFRRCRGLLATVMTFAEDRRDAMPPAMQAFLQSPYGLHNIPNLGDAPDKNEPWRFNQQWFVAGPFTLDANPDDERAAAPGFERADPPETMQEMNATFETIDGPSSWRVADGDISGLLNLRSTFNTTENVVAYARCTLTAPKDGEARLSIGSNDGARMWVNGTLVYSEHGPRQGSKHDAELTVPLHAGANTVLMKVENFGANWKLYLSVHDPERVYMFSR